MKSYKQKNGGNLNETLLKSIIDNRINLQLENLQLGKIKLSPYLESKKYGGMKLSQVPEYLHQSELYKTMYEPHKDEAAPEDIDIPEFDQIPNLEIHNIKDLEHLLQTLKYWGAPVPIEVYRFMLQNPGLDYSRFIEVQLPDPCRQWILEHEFDESAVLIGLYELGLSSDQINRLSIEEFKSLIPQILYPFRNVNKTDQEINKRRLKSRLFGNLKLFDILDLTELSQILSNLQKIVLFAARTGNVQIIEILYDMGIPVIDFHFIDRDTDICTLAIAEGHFNIVQYLCEHGWILNSGNCIAAAKSGNLEWLQYIYERNPTLLTPDIYDEAAGSGNVQILEWLSDNHIIGTQRACMNAAANGHLHCLEFAHVDDRCPWEISTCESAAKGGHLNCLIFLRSSDDRCPWDANTCAAAALGGHIECLKFLRSGDDPCPWSAQTCTNAAYGGHIECLKFARSGDDLCPWDENTCEHAAMGGHIECLVFARSGHDPCPWESDTCAAAAKCGSIECLEFARSGDDPCIWWEDTCMNAAAGGHIECLAFARSGNDPCPWDEYTCAAAASGGHLECLVFARSQNPPCPWDSNTCLSAAMNGHLACLQFARSGDDPCPWIDYGDIPETCYAAFMNDHLDCLEFALRSGCPFDNTIWGHAYNTKCYRILQCLKEIGYKLKQYELDSLMRDFGQDAFIDKLYHK